MPTPALPITPDVSVRLEGQPLVLLLDIDGTLSPIAPRPEYAIVHVATQAVLTNLVATSGVHVVFVTGRSAADGRRLVGVEGGWMIGNHGMELAHPREPAEARADVAPFAARIADAAARLAALANERSWAGVLIEDKRLTLSAHYRLAHPRIVPELTAEVTRIADELGLRVTSGKEVLEVRPPIDVNKGTAALELVESLGATHDGASLFAAGDDRTDEDLFRVLLAHQQRAVTVRVGESEQTTTAEFTVSDPDAMRDLLAEILTLRRQVPA